MKYIILIPAYDPDDKLIKLLKTINKKNIVIVVDDGSQNKDIFDVVRKYAYVISYEKNMGKGYALKKGFEYIDKNYNNYVVVTMDADAQHDYNDAINLCNYVNKNEDVFVLGRRHWDNKTPFLNRFGNSLARKIFKKATGMYIYDTQSGLRAFSYKLMNYMLNIPGNRYEYEMNVLLNLKKNNINLKEIDIKTIYIGKNESSHYSSIKDSFRIYKEIIKYKKTNKK